jgi:hypothetical protein
LLWKNALTRREKMKRGIVMLLVLLLMFVGCTRQEDPGAPAEAEKEALESAKEALPEEAAKAVEEDPDVKSCLKLVSQAKFNEALPVCLEALKKHPANEQVKQAVETAKAAVAEAAAAATDAAQDAQKEAEEKVQGAMGEATGMAP